MKQKLLFIWNFLRTAGKNLYIYMLVALPVFVICSYFVYRLFDYERTFFSISMLFGGMFSVIVSSAIACFVETLKKNHRRDDVEDAFIGSVIGTVIYLILTILFI